MRKIVVSASLNNNFSLKKGMPVVKNVRQTREFYRTLNLP
jgi:hypothetical protein